MLEVLESCRALKAFWNFEKNSKNPQKSWALKFPQLNRARLGVSQILFLMYKLYFIVLWRFLILLNFILMSKSTKFWWKFRFLAKNYQIRSDSEMEMNGRFVGSNFWMLNHKGQIFWVFFREQNFKIQLTYVKKKSQLPFLGWVPEKEGRQKSKCSRATLYMNHSHLEQTSLPVHFR